MINLSSTKIAIVLRGPPGSGKSTVISELREFLLKQFSVNCEVEVLDKFDLNIEKPNNRTYVNLRNTISKNPQCILIELGWGDGATSNPKDWIELLEKAGFKIFLFKLTAPKDVIIDRVSRRYNKGIGPPPEMALKIYDWYENNLDFVTFPKKVGLNEVVIDTSMFKVKEIVTYILNIVLHNR
ncbi:hypothetical protein [Saccharolobus caldissimus]|uniref:Uncharacterized protein n=1 Tax=Saccharolobus caldissimus TaxID=1702097 RepID=A0AAQ4CNW5_9CREN|nr:hypothetical protein [Saccharolobus caldissimus]BDB97496.1 hypothetical protein SACC_05130 [Saccharolobus caldissimus]